MAKNSKFIELDYGDWSFTKVFVRKDKITSFYTKENTFKHDFPGNGDPAYEIRIEVEGDEKPYNLEFDFPKDFIRNLEFLIRELDTSLCKPWNYSHEKAEIWLEEKEKLALESSAKQAW
jgi:hypothetical protein